MLTIRSVVVATDLTPFSFAAMEYALTLKFAFGANLHVLHVIDRGERRHEFSEKAVLRFLEKIMVSLEGPHHSGVCAVRTGNPAEEICRYVKESNIDLVVLTTHGGTGLRRAILGSVAEKVVRHSAAPVLTVKPGEGSTVVLDENDVKTDLHLS